MPSSLQPEKSSTTALMQKCHKLIERSYAHDIEKLNLRLHVDNMTTILMRPYSFSREKDIKLFEKELDGMLGEIEEVIQCMPQKSDEQHAKGTDFICKFRQHLYGLHGQRSAELTLP